MKKIDLIIVSFNRLQDLKETVNNVLQYRENLNKIFIIDNNSSDGTSHWLETLEDNIFEIILSKKNLGVAGGRNLGIQQSNADILVFLDDDAIFNINNSNPFSVIYDEFMNHDSLGIIAFKIINYYDKKIQSHEFPFVDKKMNESKRHQCAYFVGAGHAISKKVFTKCGDYPEDFFYGKEELDLSLKAIQNDFIIIYNPEIQIFHKQSPQGRQKNDEKWTQIYRNRLVISYKYYPFFYQLTANFLWFIKIILITKSVWIPIKGYQRYLKGKNNLQKNVLSNTALDYIKQHSGRLYY